jgi:hypothetical protein
VQTATVQAGNQAVQINRAANEDARWGVVKPLAAVTGTVMVEWHQNTSQTVLPAGSFGPFFGVEAYDDLPAGGPLLLASWGVDAFTGELLYLHPVNGFTPTGDVVAFGTWHRLGITLDYDLDVYSVFLDGVLKATTSFATPGGDDFTDAPLAAVAAAGDAASQAATGTAFFDNYVITSAPRAVAVPEPASLWLLMLGGVLVIRRMVRGRS